MSEERRCEKRWKIPKTESSEKDVQKSEWSSESRATRLSPRVGVIKEWEDLTYTRKCQRQTFATDRMILLQSFGQGTCDLPSTCRGE